MKEAEGTFTRTKIVCTIGPASDNRKMISSLLDSGMDVARINFSHGDPEHHRELFDLLREVSAEKGRHLAILCDIQGPKIRTGRMKEPFRVNQGDIVRITHEEVVGTCERFTIDHPGIVEELDLEDEIFINDGIIKMRVRGKEENNLVCEVRTGGLISDRKGCNIPSSNILVDIPTVKDRKDLETIAHLDPEYVAASFIGDADDVSKIREVLKGFGNDSIKIISKIERPKALENLEDIICESDGIMVARGDLGVEIPPFEVPAAQKEMCILANRASKPVIVATQMLNSMIEHSTPTRAEATDVFNAVLDGADALMLSNETAVGKHPLLVVNTMKNILKRAEEHFPYRDPDYYDSDDQCMIETVGHAAYTLINEFDDRDYSGLIIAVTDSGQSARMISKYRPARKILAVTPSERTAREMSVVWGTVPLFSPGISTDLLEKRMIDAVRAALDEEHINSDDHVVVVSSSMIVGDEGMFSCVYRVSSISEKS
jgi:pyruvate kinase